MRRFRTEGMVSACLACVAAMLSATAAAEATEPGGFPTLVDLEVRNLAVTGVFDLQSSTEVVAFVADESSQGNTDLNGDGDAFDRVLHVFAVKRHQLVDVGLALAGGAAGVRGGVEGPLVATVVDEWNQGQQDLNGDGDSSDLVVHVIVPREPGLVPAFVADFESGDVSAWTDRLP